MRASSLSSKLLICHRPFITRNGCCIKASAEVKLRLRKGNSWTLQRDGRSIRTGSAIGGVPCGMNSRPKSFLAVTVAGFVPLCSGLVTFAMLRMQTNFAEGLAVQANGHLFLLKAFTALSSANGATFTAAEPHSKLRTIIRDNFGCPETNERIWGCKRENESFVFHGLARDECRSQQIGSMARPMPMAGKNPAG
jgi:hypothetical protein